jgi:hypothetical protein
VTPVDGLIGEHGTTPCRTRAEATKESVDRIVKGSLSASNALREASAQHHQ